MEFDLVDGWRDGRYLQYRLDVRSEEIRNTNRPSFSRSLDFFHSFPGSLNPFIRIGEVRLMDKVEVNIFQLQLVETLLDSQGDIIDCRSDFCCNEELLSGYTAFFDSYAEFLFILVSLGAIEVAEASIHGILQESDKLGIVAFGASSLAPSSTSPEADLLLVSLIIASVKQGYKPVGSRFRRSV